MASATTVLNVEDDDAQKEDTIAMMESQGWVYEGETQVLKSETRFNETFNIVTWDLTFIRPEGYEGD